MTPYSSFFLTLFLCMGVTLLFAQNEVQDDINMVKILGSTQAKELQSKNPGLYAKMQFDGATGWSVQRAHDKWLQNEQVEQLEISSVKNGEALVQLLVNGTVSRDPHNTKIYLLRNGRKALILASAEEQNKAFNNRRKK